MHKNITLKLSLLFLTVFPFATLALCQGSQPSAAMISEGVSGCSLSYFSGPLTTFTRYCLSANGNILQLDSPSGFEFINNGGLMEGYGICDDTSNVSYYDYASQNSGNWGGSVATAVNATTEKFVRTSSDSIWQLTQTIQQIKASASGTGGVKIT